MRVSRVEHLSDKHKWAVVSFGSTYTPGDARSLTNPGHGYPASYDPTSYFDAFDNEDEWKETIQALTERREKFRAFTLGHVKVSTTLVVETTPTE